MFQRFLLVAGIAAAVSISMCGTANAAGVLTGGELLQLNWDNFSGRDGEFGAFLSTNTYYNAGGTDLGAAAQTQGREDFRTFCVQLNEYVYSAKDILKVDAVATVTAATDPDRQLTKQVAWLYRQFVGLKSANYVGTIGVDATANYTSGVDNANKMQVAIWSLMGWENSLINSAMGNVDYLTNNIYLKLVADNATAISAWNATDNGTSIGGVSILNLSNTTRGRLAQDMLYWNGNDPPDNSTEAVPEPMSAAMWLTTLAFGACVYRRRQSRIQ